MIFTMIALVLMLVAVAAVIRNVDTSATVIGNLAFRRDLTNRAELAVAKAQAVLNTGGALGGDAARSSDLASANYSATRLATPTGGIGVPAVLVSDSNYTTAGYACIDGSGNALASCTAGSDGIVIRWVIDRQCVTGTSTFDTASCGYKPGTAEVKGSSSLANRKPSGAATALFRISVRVTGPRNTEAYIQTTAG